jgi:LL-diaminopimelate aminotransferase
LFDLRVKLKQIILFAMTKINHHFQKLSPSNLFQEIEKKVKDFQKKNPKAQILNLSLPIESFSNGDLFLRQSIAESEYKTIKPDEIFLSDGLDISRIQEIFSTDNKIALPDPSNPIYTEVNVLAGRTRAPLKTGKFGGITYLPCVEENGFQPELPVTHVDLIYLASASSPTGVAINRKTLTEFVSYAKIRNSVILFDSTDEKFITTDAPHSIYEIEGAKEVAIELRSFPSLGFGYTVIPFELKIKDAGAIHCLNSMWRKRLETIPNFPPLKKASPLFTKEGKERLRQETAIISANCRALLEGLKKLGYTVYGGIDSPYIWCKTPPKISSWEFFHFLLENAHIISAPGIGFGAEGDGFIRLSALTDATQISLNRFTMLA